MSTKKIYSTEDLIRELQGLYKKLGHLPPNRELQEHGIPGAWVYTSRFGSWTGALKVAGIEPKYRKDLKKLKEIECIGPGPEGEGCKETFMTKLDRDGRPIYRTCPLCRMINSNSIDEIYYGGLAS